MTDTAVKTNIKEEIKIEEPSMYDVILLNDEFTTYDFVIKVKRSNNNRNRREEL